MNEAIILILLFAASVGACSGIIWHLRMPKVSENERFMRVSNTLQRFWLRRSSRAYQEQVRYALPAFMETLAMLLSAGYPLLSALQRIVSTPNTPNNALLLEIREVLRRTRTGESLNSALQKFKVALPGAEIAMFVGLLIQVNSHGGRLAELLNHQAEVRRQQIAEEIEARAQEAPVRLLLPLVVFIFPATMLPFIGVIIGKLMWQL